MTPRSTLLPLVTLLVACGGGPHPAPPPAFDPGTCRASATPLTPDAPAHGRLDADAALRGACWIVELDPTDTLEVAVNLDQPHATPGATLRLTDDIGRPLATAPLGGAKATATLRHADPRPSGPVIIELHAPTGSTSFGLRVTVTPRSGGDDPTREPDASNPCPPCICKPCRARACRPCPDCAEPRSEGDDNPTSEPPEAKIVGLIESPDGIKVTVEVPHLATVDLTAPIILITRAGQERSAKLLRQLSADKVELLIPRATKAQARTSTIEFTPK